MDDEEDELFSLGDDVNMFEFTGFAMVDLELTFSLFPPIGFEGFTLGAGTRGKSSSTTTAFNMSHDRWAISCTTSEAIGAAVVVVGLFKIILLTLVPFSG